MIRLRGKSISAAKNKAAFSGGLRKKCGWQIFMRLKTRLVKDPYRVESQCHQFNWWS